VHAYIYSFRSYNADLNDQLSWQAVSGRGKERIGPRDTKLPRMKKNKPQQTNNFPAQIMIIDRFEALRQAETDSSTKHERRDPSSPSTSIPGITNMPRLTATVEQVVNIFN
jgi:hypothetical protein